MNASALLTKKEAADLLRVSERTIDAWRASGKLKAIKLSATVTRFRPEEISQLLDRCDEALNPLIRSGIV